MSKKTKYEAFLQQIGRILEKNNLSLLRYDPSYYIGREDEKRLILVHQEGLLKIDLKPDNVFRVSVVDDLSVIEADYIDEGYIQKVELAAWFFNDWYNIKEKVKQILVDSGAYFVSEDPRSYSITIPGLGEQYNPTFVKNRAAVTLESTLSRDNLFIIHRVSNSTPIDFDDVYSEIFTHYFPSRLKHAIADLKEHKRILDEVYQLLNNEGAMLVNAKRPGGIDSDKAVTLSRFKNKLGRSVIKPVVQLHGIFGPYFISEGYISGSGENSSVYSLEPKYVFSTLPEYLSYRLKELKEYVKD